MAIFKVCNINPNPRQVAVGKVWKKQTNKQTNKQLSHKEEGMGVEKKMCPAHPRGPGLEPGTYLVLGESQKQHTTVIVLTSKLSPDYRLGQQRNHPARCVWR